MEMIKEFVLPFFATVIAMLVLVLGVAFLATMLMDPNLCEDKAAKMQLDHNWGYWQGCMIEVEESKWIPLDSYVYDDKKE